MTLLGIVSAAQGLDLWKDVVARPSWTSWLPAIHGQGPSNVAEEVASLAKAGRCYLQRKALDLYLDQVNLPSPDLERKIPQQSPNAQLKGLDIALNAGHVDYKD